MRRLIQRCAALVLLGLLTACANGTKFIDMSNQIPAIRKGEGRIYFYRYGEMQGSGVQPEIHVNGEVVGRSIPNGFFYVDRPAGEYTVSTSTEVERTTTFNLAEGETKYVKTSVSMGFLIGRVTPELQFPEQGRSSLMQLSYTPKQ